MKKLAFMILPVILFATACKQRDEQDAQHSDNPFFQTWETPHGTPPFDKIKTEHYLPAFKEAIKREEAEIKEITENKEEATFDNTILPYDRSGKMLDKVSS